MAGTIKLDLDLIGNLASDLSRLHGDFEHVASAASDYKTGIGSMTVGSAIADFAGNWDIRRGRLQSPSRPWPRWPRARTTGSPRPRSNSRTRSREGQLMARPSDWSARRHAARPGARRPGRDPAVGSGARSIEQAITEQVNRLNSLKDGDGWESESGTKFRDSAGDLAGAIEKAKGRYTELAAALDQWADGLEGLQREADAALLQAQDARDATGALPRTRPSRPRPTVRTPGPGRRAGPGAECGAGRHRRGEGDHPPCCGRVGKPASTATWRTVSRAASGTAPTTG